MKTNLLIKSEQDYWVDKYMDFFNMRLYKKPKIITYNPEFPNIFHYDFLDNKISLDGINNYFILTNPKIQKHIKNTPVFVLAHELSHWMQHMQSKLIFKMTSSGPGLIWTETGFSTDSYTLEKLRAGNFQKYLDLPWEKDADNKAFDFCKVMGLYNASKEYENDELYKDFHEKVLFIRRIKKDKHYDEAIRNFIGNLY